TVEDIIKKIERARVKMEQIKPRSTLPRGKKEGGLTIKLFKGHYTRNDTDRHRNSACQCFAGDSALAAAALMRKGGWAERQTESLADMICLHMNGHITPADGHEAHLLQQGAACDIVGTRYYDFHSSYRQAVLQKHPRDHLNKVFAAFMANEKAVCPASRAALMYQMGLPLMIKINPYAE
ncbi:MAG: hypothetical protein ACREYE_10825, partial [Gammaproteobacteria bacterium]